MQKYKLCHCTESEVPPAALGLMDEGEKYAGKAKSAPNLGRALFYWLETTLFKINNTTEHKTSKMGLSVVWGSLFLILHEC